MLPAIGSVSSLAGQGRTGVVVSAQPIVDTDDGRQLVALRIRENSGEGVDKRSTAAGNDTTMLSQDAARILTGHGQQTDSSAPDDPLAAKLPADLSAAERAEVARWQQRDQQVRQEEKAHAAVAGDLAGPINYIYQRGPDGRQYAVGGSVGIQARALSGDPEEAKQLAGRMAAAANAATNPSAQDYATARQAYAFGAQTSGMQHAPDNLSTLSLKI